MPASFAVVGPGRLGQALAKRWHAGGLRCLGFVGSSSARAAQAVRFVGAGTVLATLADLRPATVVLLAVQDDRLAEVVAASALAAAPRPCSLWLHASGRHDLAILAPLQAMGARIGSFHPLCPIPDPETGYQLLNGKIVTLAAEPRALRLLTVLARKAGLVPFIDRGGDRALYHAACALSANGVTALLDAVQRLFRAALPGAPETTVRAMSESLAGTALQLCVTRGPGAALSGPAQRGDLAVLQAHLRTLSQKAPELVPLYRELMRAASELAARTQPLGADPQDPLSQDRARAIAALLGQGGGW